MNEKTCVGASTKSKTSSINTNTHDLPEFASHPNVAMLTVAMLSVRDDHVDVQHDQQHHRQAEPDGSHCHPLLQLHSTADLVTDVRS